MKLCGWIKPSNSQLTMTVETKSRRSAETLTVLGYTLLRLPKFLLGEPKGESDVFIEILSDLCGCGLIAGSFVYSEPILNS